MVVLCAMLWSLPQIWPEYEAYVYPYWSSFLLPMVQIALMSSVYCTVVMSWERYVRICLVSRLDCNYFSEGKFRLYLILIIVFPVIFYIPKFFELQPVNTYLTKSVPVKCADLESFFNMTSLKINGTVYHVTNTAEAILDFRDLNLESVCQNATGTAYLPVNLTQVVIGHTALMKNDTYYNTYCIAINTIFASLLPFIALMFFNVSIALKLRSKKVSGKRI